MVVLLDYRHTYFNEFDVRYVELENNLSNNENIIFLLAAVSSTIIAWSNNDNKILFIKIISLFSSSQILVISSLNIVIT